MAYQTGTASSATVLLQTLVTWLVGIGWTQDRSAVEGSGWTATLHKSGNYVNLRAAMNETTIWHSNNGGAHYGLHMYLSTAYNSGQPFNNQATGAPIDGTGLVFPIGVAMVLNAGPFSNYYFFSDSAGDNIVIVVEKTPGIFVHLEWGLSLLKAGSFTGGAYFGGSTCGFYASSLSPGSQNGFGTTSKCPFPGKDGVGGCTGFVRADVDAFTGKWISIWNSASGGPQGYTGKQGDTAIRGVATPRTNFPVYAYDDTTTQFQFRQTSALDGRSNLLPIILYVLRDGTTTGYSLLGTVPNIFFSNGVGNGFSNADEYLIGATTYKMFPNFAVVKQ
jgi:hypothetical protein